MTELINVSDRYRCIFLHIPKVAGTSIKQSLELPGRGHPPWNWFAANCPSRWREYLKFTVVRNPWDRAVSAYVYATTKESYWHGESMGLHPDYKLLSGRTFEECCEILLHDRASLQHESWYPQHLWIARQTERGFESMVDMMLRYETLAGDFTRLCDRLGDGRREIPHVNASAREEYRHYYSDRTRETVARVYAVNIALFGYRF